MDLYLNHGTFLNSFATGVPADKAELLYATQRPLAFSARETADLVVTAARAVS